MIHKERYQKFEFHQPLSKAEIEEALYDIVPEERTQEMIDKASTRTFIYDTAMEEELRKFEARKEMEMTGLPLESHGMLFLNKGDAPEGPIVLPVFKK